MSLKGKRRMVDNLIRMPQKASIVDLYSDQGRIVFSRNGNSLRDEYSYRKLSKKTFNEIFVLKYYVTAWHNF